MGTTRQWRRAAVGRSCMGITDTQEQAADENAQKQERLNELLGAFREQLFPYRDQIQPMFAEFDERGDGHCEQDKFKQLLDQMGVEVDQDDQDLIMESFFDPDVEDQTRP